MNVYGAPSKVIEGLGAVDLGGEQVVEAESEALGELTDLGVVLVDQLAAVLGDLAVGERPGAVGPAAPADAVGSLVDLCGVAGALEVIRAAQPGQAGADDHDPGVARSAGGGHPAQRGGRRERGAAPRRDSPRRRRPPRSDALQVVSSASLPPLS